MPVMTLSRRRAPNAGLSRLLMTLSQSRRPTASSCNDHLRRLMHVDQSGPQWVRNRRSCASVVALRTASATSCATHVRRQSSRMIRASRRRVPARLSAEDLRSFLIAQRHGWVNRRHPPDRNTVQWDTANRGTASRDWRSLDSCAHTNRFRCVITPGGRLVGCDRESGPTARSRRDSI